MNFTKFNQITVQHEKSLIFSYSTEDLRSNCISIAASKSLKARTPSICCAVEPRHSCQIKAGKNAGYPSSRHDRPASHPAPDWYYSADPTSAAATDLHRGRVGGDSPAVTVRSPPQAGSSRGDRHCHQVRPTDHMVISVWMPRTAGRLNGSPVFRVTCEIKQFLAAG